MLKCLDHEGSLNPVQCYGYHDGWKDDYSSLKKKVQDAKDEVIAEQDLCVS